LNPILSVIEGKVRSLGNLYRHKKRRSLGKSPWDDKKKWRRLFGFASG